jgi:hypothetical protein
MGGLMRLLRLGSSGSSSGPLMAAVIALVLASGCSGADAALVDGECNQADNTVSCCLKHNPGQYERCTAKPPAQSEPINVGPPGLNSLEAGQREESQEDREKRCAEKYARCIDKIGLKPGSLYGTSQCRDCFVYCTRHGFWPLRMNKKPCPGDEE